MQSSRQEAGRLVRSFYLLEESMYVNGAAGYFRPYADKDELHARLRTKLARPDFLLGESVNIWTVQQGQLVAGLDVTEFVHVELPTGTITVHELNQHWQDPLEADLALDWTGIAAALPTLEAPLAAPGDEDLAVRLDGPHPAPDVPSYIDSLVEEEPTSEWAETLDYGRTRTL
ncbi:hypothetical protein SAMN05421805_1011733 [Saccharopolyspora antimicrobica]|uniref:Uncharacterized protein n=1 Tax=Saccharopolyspora antimicrobica TaxID=455193 RepID=A0A1I4U5C5_9PSEU|nr:hypothetical protein [Saccharopolyspora antimicrobica]RKT88692.1 hypothetical protein ATL45_7131 [Saccharopolyspora antimicrobica]SFM84182.1 hypothetical protein SAMN05421805_1011733 [Saccharopolyspora antimicrobica]